MEQFAQALPREAFVAVTSFDGHPADLRRGAVL